MFNDLQAHKLIGAAPAGGGGGEGWTRPSDWLPMPEISEVEQKFAGLFAVYDLPVNPVAIYAEGDYTVNWGDGTIEDYVSGTKAQHLYEWNDIPASTVTSEGYRQVIVTVVPQVNENLTTFDLSVRHDLIVASAYGFNVNWLDIAISAPEAAPGASIVFSEGSPATEGQGFLYGIQKIDIIHAGNMSDFSSAFYYCNSLRYIRIKNSPNALNFDWMFVDCYQLTDIFLQDCSTVTSIVGTFAGCDALKTLPIIDFPLVSDGYSAFSFCSSIENVDNINLPLVSNVSNMFVGCQSLKTIGELNFPLAEDSSAMFVNCDSLGKIASISIPSALQTGSMFLNCTSLQQVSIEILENFSLANCLLSRAAIVDVFQGLSTVTSATVDVQGNYGALELTAEDIEIATNKGWTVSY